MKTEGRAPRSDAQQDEQSPLAERPSVADYALLEELRFVRREAQAEANVAYEDWGTLLCRERYAVYRAAQDRADAAQDQLANWATEIGRELTDGPLALEALT
jgi:acyl-CoA reductase-like NAD-dependent aldehyde dehydrogenase